MLNLNYKKKEIKHHKKEVLENEEKILVNLSLIFFFFVNEGNEKKNIIEKLFSFYLFIYLIIYFFIFSS